MNNGIRLMTLVMVGACLVGAGCASAKKPQWRAVATAEDCSGTDVACTMTGATPNPGLCNAAFQGKTAVCWDGSTYHGSTECFGVDAWCTYKTTPAKSCVGGGNKGIVYECK